MTNKVQMLQEDIETVWCFSKFHIGEWVEVYTTDKAMMRRYEAFAPKYPDHCRLVKENQYSMTFSIDPKCMGFKPKVPRKGPVLTEDQKQENRMRLENLRKPKI